MKYYIEVEDKRTAYLKSFFTQSEIEDNINNLKENDCVVFSPAKKLTNEDILKLPNNIFVYGGMIFGELNQTLENKGITHKSFMQDEIFAIENAKLTAEGFLSVLKKETESSLFNLKIALLGCGRVTRTLCSLFDKMGIRFDVISLKNEIKPEIFYFTQRVIKKQNANWGKYDVIVNSIPSKNCLSEFENHIKDFCIVFELASFDCLDMEKERQFRYIKCPALPQKFTPKHAGKLMHESIIRGKEK